MRSKPIFLLQYYSLAKLAANARIAEIYFFESVGFAAEGKAFVERFGIDVKTDGALVEFRKIQDLMDRFFELDLGGQTIRKLEAVGFLQLTEISFLVLFDDAEILPAQTADRDRHPAHLIGVIVNARRLPALPAQNHQLEPLVLVEQISGVKFIAPEKIGRDRIDIDGIFGQKLINIIAPKIGVGNLAQSFDQVFDFDGFHNFYIATEGTESGRIQTEPSRSFFFFQDELQKQKKSFFFSPVFLYG